MGGIAAWWSAERRTPLIFALKLVGFVVSFAASALILGFIDFERHYDAFNPNADRIARGVETRNVATGSRYTSLPYAFADAARTGLPGVEAAARVQPLRAMVERGRDRFNETLFFAEPSLLSIFPVTIVAGSRAPLDAPSSLLISERAAQRYFGDADPVGRTLSLGGARDVTVAAVMRDWRPDSHIRPDFLLSLDTFFSIAESSGVEKAAITGWTNCHCYVTYLLFDSPSSMAQAEKALPALQASRQGIAVAARSPIALQPLRDAYLGSRDYSSYLDHARKGDPTELTVFGSAALLLLLISGLSFANFSTAQAAARGREFAVRRVLGARPSRIAARMAFDGAATALTAAALGLAVAIACAPGFGAFVDRPLGARSLLHGPLVAQLSLLALAVGALAGLPAGAAMARIQPTALLRGRFGNGRFVFSATGLRRALVALQFIASFVLIVLALAMHAELNFVREQARLGFDPENLLVVNAEGAEPAFGELRARISALAGVRSFSIARSVPTTPLTSRVTVARIGADEGANDAANDGATTQVFMDTVDFGYFDALGVRMLAGRNFDARFGGDSLELGRYAGGTAPDTTPTVNAIVNASAAGELGFASPPDAVGRTLAFSAEDGLPFDLRIVGVAQDVRYGGPREQLPPILYLARTDWNVNLHTQSYLLVGTSGAGEPPIRRIGEIWDELVPQFVARVDSMQERIARQTENERRQLRLVTGLVAAAVLLSVFGILGFAALAMNHAARGLAIRRVFGATRREIVVLVCLAQLRTVGVALLVGGPVAFWIAARWLDEFALRTPILPSWFLVGGLAIAAVSFSTLAAFTFRLVGSSPIEHIHTE
jgi:putative ABC transport system permease protein